MNSDEDDFFYGLQSNASGLTLSHTNNKSSVLCPETQDITSQYLILQQLDAHEKMVARAKGCVDTTEPKSMQSFKSLSSQRKKKLLQRTKNESQLTFETDCGEGLNKPSSSRLSAYNSEEDENQSSNTSLVNKAIQTGIPVSNFTSKTAEKISWYLEALSLGELQSQYFALFNDSSNGSRNLGLRNTHSMKRIIRGDIMDWHKEHFIKPKKPFSPRILADTDAKSKIKDMRCYNPPFRRKKVNSSHSSDTFESFDDEDNEEEEIREINQTPKTSDNSLIEEETLINKYSSDIETLHNNAIPHPPYYSKYLSTPALSKSEEEKYLDFLSKVTEDILRSGVYSDKAIQQAFEFHLQFYNDDSNKEKLQSLLKQVLESLKITDEENFSNLNSFLSPSSRPCTPPEKESSALFTNDNFAMPIESNPSLANDPVSIVNNS